MAVYLARYPNVPPALLPGESGERLDDLPAEAEEIRAAGQLLWSAIAAGASGKFRVAWEDAATTEPTPMTTRRTKYPTKGRVRRLGLPPTPRLGRT
jgi:hypothetical protein